MSCMQLPTISTATSTAISSSVQSTSFSMTALENSKNATTTRTTPTTSHFPGAKASMAIESSPSMRSLSTCTSSTPPKASSSTIPIGARSGVPPLPLDGPREPQGPDEVGVVESPLSQQPSLLWPLLLGVGVAPGVVPLHNTCAHAYNNTMHHWHKYF